MNTYNENLRSSVAKTLQTLDSDLKKVNANANAAMFTLYYAQGATFTAITELEKAKTVEGTQEGIKTEAVNNSNLSKNLMNTAAQAGTIMKQSVSNVSVGASNVQSSANAVVRLAGDVGNIFNIISAADYETDIYKLAAEANALINETAYTAEWASQLALEASVLASKVTTGTVQDNSKNVNDSVNNLLKIVSDDFNKISQRVNDDNAAVATVSTNEKAAEGAYADLRTVSGATAEAYNTTNDQLNLDLTAAVSPGFEDSKFKVSFKWLYSPFLEKGKKLPYPVQDYNLIVVKDKQKSTFSINTAEDIRQNYETRCIELSPYMKDDLQPQFSQEFTFDAIPFPVPPTDTTAPTTYKLLDSDGDEITTGTDYVVFVYAVYKEEYKKKLNTYDDFLSAPSTTFTFTIVLKTAVFANDSGSAAPPSTASDAAAAAEAGIVQVKFNVNEREGIKAQYRCAFLPTATAATQGMLDEELLAKLDDDIQRLQKDADELEPEIVGLKSKLLETSDQENEFRQKYTDIFAELQKFIALNITTALPTGMSVSAKKQDDNAKQLVSKARQSIPQLANPTGELKEDLPKMLSLLPARHADQVKLTGLEQQQTALLQNIEAVNSNKIDFIFNLQLAMGLTAGSYTVADDAKATEGADGSKNYTVPITPATTDNFGNVLVTGKSYIPVVVSVANDEEEIQSKFTNSWTGIGAHKPITI